MLRGADLGRGSSALAGPATERCTGDGDPRGVPGMGVLAPLRRRLRVRVRRLVPKEPAHTFKILVRQAVTKEEDTLSAELGDAESESTLGLLIIGVAPTITYHESTMAGQFPICLSPSMDRKVMAAESRKGSMFGNPEKSKGFWYLESIQSQWYDLKRKYYKGKDIVESWGKGPGLYKDIGQEARCLLQDDFLDKNLKGRKTHKDDESSFTVGMSFRDPESVSKLLFRGRVFNTSFALDGTKFTQDNGAVANRVVSRVGFHNVLGPDSEAILNIPLPYLNEKMELRAKHRYAGFSGHISSGAPNAQMSKVEGVTSVEATIFKELENKLTSFGVIGNYSSVNLPWYKKASITIGASHAVPSQDLVIKGRLSSSGIGGILAKKSFFGKFSLAVSSEFDFNRVHKDLREGLKCGIVLSIP